MAGSSIIMDVSKHMLSLVRKSVCPSLLSAQELVDTQSPDDRGSGSALRVYLYSIVESSAYSDGRSVSAHSGSVSAPSLAFSLQYIIFFNPHSQSLPDPLLQHYAFGRILQTFHSNPLIEISRIHSEATSVDPNAWIIFSKLDLQQKQQIWSGLSSPLRPAVYVEAGPLLLSGDSRDVPFTREMEGQVNPN